MNQKTLAGMLMLVMAMSIVSVTALDADTPYTVQLDIIVPSDTSFSVSLAGAESQIDFDDEMTGSNNAWVEPDSQDNTTATPIIEITNLGNIALNYTLNVTELPAWAILKADVNADMSTTVTVNDTTDPETSRVATNQAADATTNVYLWVNTTDADAGTNTETFQINSEIY